MHESTIKNQASSLRSDETGLRKKLDDPDPLLEFYATTGNATRLHAIPEVFDCGRTGQLAMSHGVVRRWSQCFGNRHVSDVLQSVGKSDVATAHEPAWSAQIQPKLDIGAADDPFEQEADRVARQVVKRLHVPFDQAVEPLQNRSLSPGSQVALPRKPAISSVRSGTVRPTQSSVSADAEAPLRQARGKGQPLSNQVREPMEDAFGMSLDRVRIHADSRSDRLARSVHARAFTAGTDIFFRRGKYDPQSRSGQNLLAHELTHVVQQTGSDGTAQGDCGIQRFYEPPAGQQVTLAKTLAMKKIWYQAAIKVLGEISQREARVKQTLGILKQSQSRPRDLQLDRPARIRLNTGASASSRSGVGSPGLASALPRIPITTPGSSLSDAEVGFDYPPLPRLSPLNLSPLNPAPTPRPRDGNSAATTTESTPRRPVGANAPRVFDFSSSSPLVSSSETSDTELSSLDFPRAASVVGRSSAPVSKSPLLAELESAVADIESPDREQAALATPVSGNEAFEKHFPKKLPQALAEQVSAATGTDPKAVWEGMKHAYIRTVNNERDWAPIVKEINFGTETEPEFYTSSIIPVNAYFHPTYGPQGKNYGSTGLGSISAGGNLSQDVDWRREVARATNLAYTEYREGRAEDQGKVLFAAFRSGVSSGKKLADPKAQEEATRSHLHEVLEAMLIKYIEQQDPVQQELILSGDEVPTVPVSVINLESQLIPGEKKHTRQQEEMLREFGEGIHEFDLVWPAADGSTERNTVSAQFKVINFNFGVNAQGASWFQNNDEAYRMLGEAVQSYLYVSKYRLNAVKIERDQMRRQVSRSMPGASPDAADRPDDLRAQLAELEQRIAMVEFKNSQIQALWADVQKGGGEYRSYEMAVKVANLTYLIDFMVYFHCKSGKDRTGLQDVEAKYFAHQLHRTAVPGDPAQIPRYALTTQAETDAYHRLLWESGNLEFQAYNTGGQGFKIAPTVGKLYELPSDSGLAARVGGLDLLKKLQGLKRYTGAAYF